MDQPPKENVANRLSGNATPVLPDERQSTNSTPNVSANITLLVNGVGFNTPEAKVLSLLGKPQQIKKKEFDDCAGGYHRDLIYDGLRIDLLSDANGRNYAITQMDLTSPRWTIFPDLQIGDSFTRIREVFGEPIYPKEEEGCLFYGIKGADGLVTFCQADGILVRIYLNQTLC
ncbi:MAG: hypothetical protein ABL952_01530 [Pyrinomonadaceae bacterium]